MPPKRKDRPKSSSSDAFSLEGKKSKEANRSTSTSEAEDEVLTVPSMADDLGKKVDMILNKLQQLDNIEARLDNLHKSIASLQESFAFLERDVQNLKDKTEKTRTKVDDLEKSVEFREVEISDMQKILKKSSMKPKSLKCNSYTRNITVEGRILCFLESRKMMCRSTPKARQRIITWRIQKR